MFFYVLQRSTLPSIFDCRGIYMWFFFFETLESKSLVCAFFCSLFFNFFMSSFVFFF